ncbi:NAD-dependent epimerase/dehydratase family protein (plasmid) [Fusobacterium sp. SB021]|uniref:NAD-dependent epimerase/dehydratase family protein n=1 Tax=Fusobacterium sp. SB021 TaxID=2744227 RepID=UPI003CEBA8D7
MKKSILIVGENSYIGNYLEQYLNLCSKEYEIETVSSVNNNWKNLDFKNYDVLINVAAIVHNPKAESKLYYKVNRDLVIDLVNKAKKEGVKQFIQMSTMNVFGLDDGIIDEKTPFLPNNDYGKSKLEADNYLNKIKNEKFKVCIIRPPMVYGRGCKGNYRRLEKYIEYIPIFPNLKNKKDFIFIENLTDFIKYAIDNKIDGIFYPRDPEPISTYEMVKSIALNKRKPMFLLGIFNPIIKLLIFRINIIKTVFSDNYCIIENSIDWKPKFNISEAIKKIYKE